MLRQRRRLLFWFQLLLLLLNRRRAAAFDVGFRPRAVQRRVHSGKAKPLHGFFEGLHAGAVLAVLAVPAGGAGTPLE
jgi:hypothetical protein